MSGSVKLILSSTNYGNCNVVRDTLTLTINHGIYVNAGSNQTKCSNNPAISLSGAVSGSTTTGEWSTLGVGSFTPNAQNLLAVYTPSAADTVAGQVNLVLTSTNNNNCDAVSDTMILYLLPGIYVNAGDNNTVCANNPDYNLSGQVWGGTNTGVWASSGSGSFNPSEYSLTATYIPSAADTGASSVTLTLQSTGNGLCLAVSDPMTLTINPGIYVNPGTDKTVCANNAAVSLNGIVSGSTTKGRWSTAGTGTFLPADTVLNATYYPSPADTSSGSVLLTLTSRENGLCLPVAESITITIGPGVYVDAGSHTTVCANNPNTILSGQAWGSTTTGAWTSTGSGNFSLSANQLNATYIPSAADTTAGSVNLILTSTNNGQCIAAKDTMVLTINDGIYVNAGNDFTVCADYTEIALNGLVSGASTTGIWSHNGAGDFSPDDEVLNASYQINSVDTNNTSLRFILTSTNNGLCNAVKDTLIVSINTGIYVAAGPNQTVCANNRTVVLAGMVSGGTVSGTWTTSGDGSFPSGSTALTGNYIPGNADVTAGNVKLILTSTFNGLCSAVRDTMEIFITPAPVVDAGSDVTVCANNASVELSGNVSGASLTGQWTTSGNGSFDASDTQLDADYLPGSNDLTAGSAWLYLTATNIGNCSAVYDSMKITITSAPVVMAGSDTSVCKNNAVFELSGSISGGASEGAWSTDGDGSFSPNINDLNAAYTPGTSDTTNGTVTLTLTTTNHGSCTEVSDNFVLSFTEAPWALAGDDFVVCADTPSVTLNGLVGIATGGTWSRSGTGSFNNANLLATTYTLSSADKTAGSVSFVLTTTGNGGCLAARDTVLMTITTAPTVSAGPDKTVCASNATVTLNGAFTVAGGVEWWASGGDNFTPASNQSDVQYNATPADTTAGHVVIIISTTGNGMCRVHRDTMNLYITEGLLVDAGTDQTICAHNSSVQLNGSVPTTGVWSSSGSGSFQPDDEDMNAEYIPSAADTAQGYVDIYLESTNNGSCAIAYDTMRITIDPGIYVYAGSSSSVCANNADVILGGDVWNGTTSGIWNSSGSGSFDSETELNTTYHPSGADISAGNFVLRLISTNNGDCHPVRDSIVITATNAPIVNAGSDSSVCSNNPILVLDGNISGPTATGTWSTSGSGQFTPSSDDLAAQYTASVADTTAGNVYLILSSTNNGNCIAVVDSMQLFFTEPPVVLAGDDQTVCSNANISLEGTVLGAASTGTWTVNGTGSFSPSANSLLAVYSPSPADTVTGSLRFILTSTNNGGCLPARDTMDVAFIPSPIVFAGLDVTVCANKDTISINGIIGGSTSTGIWSTSGDGEFLPDELTLNAQYIPGTNDISNGIAWIRLTTLDHGVCAETTDSFRLTITPKPLVDAGDDVFACANNATVSLNGQISGGASAGIWETSGNGEFYPVNNTLSTTYYASPEDTIAGTVYLVLTSTDNGDCWPEKDTVVFTITDPPLVDAGNDQTICATSPLLLIGTVTGGAGTGQWTTNGSGQFDDAEQLDATYTFSAADTAAGSIIVVLSATNLSGCAAVMDTVLIDIAPAAAVDAGSDQTVCGNNNNVSLSGNVWGAAVTGRWTTSGDGIFVPNDSALTATYVPGTADTSAGSVVLVLESTNNVDCPPTTDTCRITITEGPLADAGIDLVVCKGDTVFLQGNLLGSASTGTWTSDGSGSFSPNANLPHAKYIPSQQDLDNGPVSFILTTTNNGDCLADADTVEVSFTDRPIVDAGIDQSICSNNAIANIAGSVSGSTTTGIWSSSGTGTFTDNVEELTNIYTPSSADITAGMISLILTSTNGCTHRDTMVISVIDPPLINAGTDTVVCFSAPSIQLSGIISGGAGTGNWTSSGTGLFDPSSEQLDAEYYFTAADSAAGGVRFILTTTNNGNCLAVSDTVMVTMTGVPVVEAGNPFTFCANNANIPLNGSIVGGASTGIWASSGTGTFTPSATQLNATYKPGTADKNAGEVWLYLTSVGSCQNLKDSVKYTFTPAPEVYAGDDITVCANNMSINLTGSVTGPTTTGTWASTGTGIFSPSATSLNASYIPSAADTVSGTLRITLRSTNNGMCLPVRDTVNLTITPKPAVNAGADQYVCAGLSANLNGSVRFGATTGTWTTSGSGSFSSSADQLNARIFPAQPIPVMVR
jgi:hypothetical protein